MKYKIFHGIVDEYKRKKPVLFGLEQDEVCSTEEIKDLENMLQIEFSEKYKQFIMNFGGGYFGYANFYSLDPKSNFYLLAHNAVPIGNYLRIADNGCGNCYLLKVDNRKCLDQVFFYEHGTKTICDTEYADILEYLVKVGLKAEYTNC